MNAQWVVLEAGCAECSERPLMRSVGMFSTEADAMMAALAASYHAEFEPHPDGGLIAYLGRSGALWIVPLAVLTTEGTVPS